MQAYHPLRRQPAALDAPALSARDPVPVFDLLRLDGIDMRRLPLSERKAALSRLLRRSGDGIQHVHHHEGEGDKLFESAFRLGLEGIVSKLLTAPYKSGPCKSWIKVRNRPNKNERGRQLGGL